MDNYVLSCESTADLSAEKFCEIGVEYVCFHYYLDGQDLPDDLGVSMAFPDFYQAMVDGADTRTAAVGTGDYVAFWRPFLEAGRDILHVSLSSGISSTFESACIAADQLRAEFPERTIYVADSRNASSGFGLMMQLLSDMRAAGASIDDVYEWARTNTANVRSRFFSTDLTFYIKGGRVSPVSGFVGNLLGICPLLEIDEEGKLIPVEKVRSKKKVIKRIVECMLKDCKGGAEYSGSAGVCAVHHRRAGRRGTPRRCPGRW